MRGEVTGHEDHWWKIVEDFLTYFNDYFTQLLYYSDIICSDDTISKWYGQGGHWINLGFPMYVAMDRKMEKGEEIKNAACRRLGIKTWHRILSLQGMR